MKTIGPYQLNLIKPVWMSFCCLSIYKNKYEAGLLILSIFFSWKKKKIFTALEKRFLLPYLPWHLTRLYRFSFLFFGNCRHQYCCIYLHLVDSISLRILALGNAMSCRELNCWVLIYQSDIAPPPKSTVLWRISSASLSLWQMILELIW